MALDKKRQKKDGIGIMPMPYNSLNVGGKK